MPPIDEVCADVSDESCRDSRAMLQEAIISARKELEAAKLSARAELDAKQQQLMGIRRESEAPAAEVKLQAADTAAMPSPERLAAEQKAMVHWERQEEGPTVNCSTIQSLAEPEVQHGIKSNDEIRRSGRALDLEERLKFGAGPHCEGSRSPKKKRTEPPETSGVPSTEAIQAEHQAQRESWSRALVAHEEELMKERELRAQEKAAYDERLKQEHGLRSKEIAALQEELQKERSQRAREAATHREEWVLHMRQGVEQLAEERRTHELELAARESELAEERELRRQEAAANSELQTLLDKSVKEVASLRSTLRTKGVETASVEQCVASATSSVGSATSSGFNLKAADGSQSDGQQKSSAQPGKGLARRLFEGDAGKQESSSWAPPSQERTPKWPMPAPAALAAASAVVPASEPVNPVQGSVLKRINALEAAKHYELSRAASQPPPAQFGAKPNLYQEASETTPRGKVFSIRHKLERRAPVAPSSAKSTTPCTSPRNPPSWVPEEGGQRNTEVRWVKGNTASTPTMSSSLVKERVRRLENGGHPGY